MRNSTVYSGVLAGVLAVTSAVCLILMDKNRVESSIFVCPYCGARFALDYKDYIKSPHIGRKLKTVCPKCERYCYCDSRRVSMNTIAKHKTSVVGILPTNYN